MADMISLDQLPPEFRAMLEAYKVNNIGTRSPVREQLTDLRTPRTEKGRLHRPTFMMSVESDEHEAPYVHQEFPKLMFHDRGAETVVMNREALEALGPEWHDSPVVPVEVTPLEQARAEFDALSDEDKALVLELQRKAKVERAQKLMAALTDQELERFASATPDAPRRGPGRPRRGDSA